MVILALAIGYGAGYWTHLVRLPFGLPTESSARAGGSPGPKAYRHPLIATLKQAQDLKRAGKLQDAQKVLRDALVLYPQAEEAQAARDLLGEINTELFF